MWLGAEAAELGPSGVAVVAEATGVAADTVRRGRKEADEGIGPGAGRSRRGGGGRKRAESHDEELVATFESLIDPVTRGDPMSPLRWTSKSIRALTAALRDNGHLVSDFVVRRLLRERGYSLQANVKTAEGTVNLRSCGRSANHISLIRHTRPGESRRRTGENRPRIAQVDSL